MMPQSVKLGMLKLTSSILEEIKEGNKLYLGLINRSVLIYQGKEVRFIVDKSGIMKLRDKVYVPSFPKLKKRII